MPPTQLPTARRDGVVLQKLADETLIYDLNSNKAFCLNQTSAAVFELCDGRRDIAAISDAMSIQLNMLVGEEMVWLALDELNKNGLLETGAAIPDSLNGLSRRQIISKIGAASMLALPLISFIVAPNAVNAQSITCLAMGALIPNFCSTSTPDCSLNAGSQCCSGMAISVMRPCPIFPASNSACECT